MLIVPSGALRNLEPEALREGLRAFVEAGGQALVMAQAFGRDFEAVPGPLSGYGWQEDILCFGRNIPFLRRA